MRPVLPRVRRILGLRTATLPYDSTGFAPIQLEMGYLPRISFDWERLKGPRTVREKLSYKEA